MANMAFPTFHGRSDEDAMDFINNLDVACVVSGRDNDVSSLHLFPLLLKVEARTWFNTLLPTVRADWGGLRIAFMQRFGARETSEKLWKKLNELRFVNVFEYGEDELQFMDLWNKWVAPLAIGKRAPDFLKRDRFVAGLCLPLEDKVKARFPVTFEAADVACLKVRKLRYQLQHREVDQEVDGGVQPPPVLECESAYALWQKLCNTYAKDTASNKVFMMRKLFNLRMKESASVASHINDFDSLFAQIRAQRINIDDEMKAIFLLCSLPPSWDIFCTAISNSAPNGTLVYIDVTSSLLSEEMRRQAMGSSHHGEAHYVQKDGKQRKGHPWNRESKKEGNRDASKGRSKSPVRHNVQCHYCDKFGHIKKNCYAWKRDKGKGKDKDNDAKEEKPKSSVKIEELNIVQDDCDAQDINMLTENNDVFYDAQETLSLQSSMPAELLVSGEVSHTWILDFGSFVACHTS
ncbi:hypothetical protein L7F22_017645 [Adiantum nelumboides]|nr:hypothetical protein [Adiantum nelumboides]